MLLNGGASATTGVDPGVHIEGCSDKTFIVRNEIEALSRLLETSSYNKDLSEHWVTFDSTAAGI